MRPLARSMVVFESIRTRPIVVAGNTMMTRSSRRIPTFSLALCFTLTLMLAEAVLAEDAPTDDAHAHEHEHEEHGVTETIVVTASPLLHDQLESARPWASR